MSKKQRQTFVERLPPNFYEWDAVLNEETTIKELKVIAAKVESNRPSVGNGEQATIN